MARERRARERSRRRADPAQPWRGAWAVLLAAWSLLGAGAAQPEPDPAPAAVRVLHLSPDAPLVDVLVDGRLALRDVAHRDRSAYVTLPAGRHEISVYPHRLPLEEEGGAPPPAAGAETPADAPGEPAGSAEPPPEEDEAEDEAGPRARPLEPVTALLDLEAGSYTTLVLTGNFEPPSSAEGLGHLSLSVEPQDAQVAVTGPQGFAVQRQGEQLLRDLEPGTYRIEVRRAGYRTAEYQVEVRPGRTAVATLTLQAAEGPETTDAPLVAQEEEQATWRRLELQPYTSGLPLPPAGHALVRFVHVAPSVPPLAVAVVPVAPGPGLQGPQRSVGRQGDAAGAPEAMDADGGGADGTAVPALFLERLAYPNPADFQPIVAGTHRIEFRVAGTASVLHALPEVRLRAGNAYTLYLATSPEGGGLEVVPSVEAVVPQEPPPGGEP